MRRAALPVHLTQRPCSGPGRARAEYRAEFARSTPTGICTGPFQRVSAIRGRVGIRACSQADSRPNARTVGNPRPSPPRGIPAPTPDRMGLCRQADPGGEPLGTPPGAVTTCADRGTTHSSAAPRGRASKAAQDTALFTPPREPARPLRRAKKPSFRAQIVPCPVPSAAVCWAG